MATTNSTIMGKFMLKGTNDHMQRMPNDSQAAIRQTVKDIFDPRNIRKWNQFAMFMVNEVGYSYLRQQAWMNPLREFTKQKLYFGSSVTETQLNWVRAHSFDPNAEDQFKTYFPDGLQAFHTQNREDKYPISISRAQTKAAFQNEYGLNQLIAQQFQLPINSDEYDTYLAMLNLFTIADAEYGLYRQNVSAAPTTEEASKEMLQTMQEVAFNMQAPTSIYSQVDLPVVVREDELYAFIRADAMAGINVQGLAVLFNADRAEIPYRYKVIPTNLWPLRDKDYAILTTSDFFQVYDTEYTTASQEDPSGLKLNSWLHHWQIVSFSPFVPVVVFSSDEGTEVPTVTMTTTALNLTVSNNTAAPGENIGIAATLTGTVNPEVDAIEVAPDSYTSTLTCSRTTGELGAETTVPVPLNSRTYIDRYGVLHIQKTGLQAGDVITVTAVTTYIDPSTNTASALSGTATVTIE